MNAAVETHHDPWIGRKIDGRYEVVELLGKGGAGAVYRAKSLRIPKDFAIKIIPLPAGSSEKEKALDRLRQEVVALASINHPHIVGIVEAAHLDENHIGIITEFIEGKSFDRAWFDGDLELAEVLEIAIQVAMALQAVHARGMLHRDVKPENVLIRRIEGGSLHACLVDFGIVKSSEESVDLTRGFLGTPAYAAPEMVLDDSEIGPETDLFGIGVLIYFALEGHGPFSHENVWISLQMHDDWSGLDTDSYSLGPTTANLLRDLMARDSKDRPSSAVEVVERLKAALAEQANLDEVEHRVPPDVFNFTVGPHSIVWQGSDGVRRFDIESHSEVTIDHIPVDLVLAAADETSVVCIAGSSVHIYGDDRTHRVIRTDFDELTAAAIHDDDIWICGESGQILRVGSRDRKTYSNGNGPIRHIVLDGAGGIALSDDQSHWTATTSDPLEPLRRSKEQVRQFFRSRDGYLLGITTDDQWKVVAWRTGDVYMAGDLRPDALAYALAGRELVALVSDGAGLSTVSTMS